MSIYPQNYIDNFTIIKRYLASFPPGTKEWRQQRHSIQAAAKELCEYELGEVRSEINPQEHKKFFQVIEDLKNIFHNIKQQGFFKNFFLSKDACLSIDHLLIDARKKFGISTGELVRGFDYLALKLDAIPKGSKGTRKQ